MPKFKRGPMTLEQCAARMTALLARPGRKRTRTYLATLPKRPPITVTPLDYQQQKDRDAARYVEWEARGKTPSPSVPPQHKDRMRPRKRDDEHQKLMIAMLAAQAGLCALCGDELHADDSLPSSDPERASFDHVVPRSRGGANIGNRIAAHRRCNGAKSDRMPTGCEVIWLAAVNARLDACPPPQKA